MVSDFISSWSLLIFLLFTMHKSKKGHISTRLHRFTMRKLKKGHISIGS